MSVVSRINKLSQMTFGRKSFSPRRASIRERTSISELAVTEDEKNINLDSGTAFLKLNDVSLRFNDGVWHVVECGGVTSDAVERLEEENNQLTEENNLLKLKVAILLDMLSETTAESHMLEKERDKAIRYLQKLNKTCCKI